MTDAEFELIVEKLEAEAKRQPNVYRTKVTLLAALGNLYIAAVLVLTVALLIALCASLVAFNNGLVLKIIILVGLFLWVVIKSLWITIAPLEGIEIKASQAPQLFLLIEELRRSIDTPGFHHVLITDTLNAGVVQLPRFGIFGGYQNYLLIGLPLLKSLSIEQFKAVLAHEFGHLSRGHARLSNWIYRQRLRWSRLLAALEQSQSRATFVFTRFLDWFAPYLNAYSFPLARANEYEADMTAVRLTSSAALAQALTGTSVIGSYLAERYWPNVHKLANDQPVPGYSPYYQMGQGITSGLQPESTQKWLAHALEAETSLSDTHPSLADRLKAIRETAKLAPPTTAQSADQLLGGAIEDITRGFDKRWQEVIGPSWEQRYCEVQNGRQRLNELNAKTHTGAALTLDEAFERTRLTADIGNDTDAAIAQLWELREQYPANPSVSFHLGMRLLHSDDDRGVSFIEQAMDLDGETAATACELLRDYCWRKGKKEEAHVWHARLIEQLQTQQAANAERSGVTLKDTFEPHGLSENVIAGMREQLRGIRDLREAYFVKKKVNHFQKRPCYVVGYRVTGPFQWHSDRKAQGALRRIHQSVTFPGQTMIICVERGDRRFARRFRAIEGARLV